MSPESNSNAAECPTFDVRPCEEEASLRMEDEGCPNHAGPCGKELKSDGISSTARRSTFEQSYTDNRCTN